MYLSLLVISYIVVHCIMTSQNYIFYWHCLRHYPKFVPFMIFDGCCWLCTLQYFPKVYIRIMQVHEVFPKELGKGLTANVIEWHFFSVNPYFAP